MFLRKSSKLGQSLIELIVVIGAISLLLTGLMAAIVLGAKNSQIAKDKDMAIGLAEEKIAILRQEKDSTSSFWDRTNPEEEILANGFKRRTTFNLEQSGDTKKMTVQVRIFKSYSAGERELTEIYSVFTDWLTK